MLDNPSQFLSSEQPSELKNLDVALNIAGVVKIHLETCDCGRVLNGKEHWRQ